jgi:hypothetical protein
MSFAGLFERVLDREACCLLFGLSLTF